MKQSFAWWAFFRNGVEAEAQLCGAARVGCAGVEMLPPTLWPLSRALGLEIATISGHTSLSDGLNRRANHARIEDEIRAHLDEAVAWNIPNLIVFSGNRNGLGDDEGAAATIEGLRRVAPLAEAAGVTLLLELLNSRVNHPDYQADRTAWGVGVCQAVGSARVKLLYDVYHMQIMEGDIIHTIETHHPHIGHYHTAGVPGRHDLDDTQELHYPAIVRAIAATGFAGFIGHEFFPRGEPVAALEAAVDLCAAAVGSPGNRREIPNIS